MTQEPCTIRRRLTLNDVLNVLGQCYRSLVLKAVAIDTGNVLKNIMITGYLTHVPPKSILGAIEKEYQRLKSIGATSISKLKILYEVRDPKDLLEMTSLLQAGEAVISSNRILFRSMSGLGIDVHTPPWYPDISEYPSLAFHVYSNSLARGLKELEPIEEELKTYGYRSIDGLCIEWLKMECSYSLEASIGIPIYVTNPKVSYNSHSQRLSFLLKIHKALLPALRIIIDVKDDKGNLIAGDAKNFGELMLQNHQNDFVTLYTSLDLPTSLQPAHNIAYSITSSLGTIICDTISGEVLLFKSSDLTELFSLFIDFDIIKNLLSGGNLAELGGHIGRRPELALQRIVTWLFTHLGFRAFEMEGTRFKEFIEPDGSKREVDMILYDEESRRIYIVDFTIRVPDHRKIDNIVNVKDSLKRRGIYAIPVIITSDSAQETKKNVHEVRVLDREDLEKIIDCLSRGLIKEARKIIIDV